MITKIRILSNPQNLTTVVSSSGLTTVVKKQELLVTTVSSGIIGGRDASIIPQVVANIGTINIYNNIIVS